GAVITGADGTARVDVPMPDNVTRYRIVAIAATERQFGKGESAVTARLPMMVRPSAPRFLNFGDSFQLPIVVQNQTDAPLEVKLAIRASNLALEGATDGRVGRTLTVPPNDRVEVRIPAAAALAGTARFQVVATAIVNGKAIGDAAEIALPVWTPATTEAFATYGVIDDGAIAQPVALPGQVVPQFGGLDVSIASTNLQALTDALLYIVHYPYDCSEQRSARIASIAALRDVLAAFHARDLPSPAALASSMAKDMTALLTMQDEDGGFGYWDRERTHPHLTIFVTNALLRARAKGYAVPPVLIARGLAYLASIEDHLPDFYGEAARFSLRAYALATRRLAGQIDVAKAKALVADAGGVDKLALETAGFLLSAIAGQPAAAAERAALVKHALDKVSETAEAANFTTDYGDDAYLLLASDTRVDAVMLDAMIAEQPGSDLIPKIVTGLLAKRKAGRWMSTQENTFVLQALDRYFQTYEKATPNFVARVWLGADDAGTHAFQGRSTVDFQIPIPMATVAAHDASDLVIAKDGKGRLYYRIGMTYAPASLAIEPADRGFVVERRYEAIDDPQDVTRDAQRVWHVKAGARVRVRLQMVNENRRYHVALVDPMPAGFEGLNPALATTGPLPDDPGGRKPQHWWERTWYEHQNMRDERVEAFTLELDAGVHPYTYVARATTPGRYVVPPPKAEEMYMPETFGRGGTDRVVVE
ncbi:MAG: hypothetical protein NT062_26915, partial [Proteobacteria bacterium]|nr:hypothetical protein [Pseudomonadota bacterium]